MADQHWNGQDTSSHSPFPDTLWEPQWGCQSQGTVQQSEEGAPVPCCQENQAVSSGADSDTVSSFRKWELNSRLSFSKNGFFKFCQSGVMSGMQTQPFLCLCGYETDVEGGLWTRQLCAELWIRSSSSEQFPQAPNTVCSSVLPGKAQLRLISTLSKLTLIISQFLEPLPQGMLVIIIS